MQVTSYLLNQLLRGSTGSLRLLAALTAYWQFNPLLSDATGNSNTLTNVNTVTQAPGPIGQAANFVAASDQSLTRASLSTAPAASGGGISLWINWTSIPAGNCCVVEIGTALNGPGIVVSSSGQVGLLVDNSDTTVNVPTNDGKWHNLVLSWATGSHTNLYVDGAFATNIFATPTFSGGGALSIGTGPLFASNWFNGKIAELGIWSRQLTASDAAVLWNGGNPFTYPFNQL